MKWRKSNGAPYASFTTLIGLCEPAFGDAPTNSDLAQHLFLGENGIERHLASIYQAFGFQGRRHQREVIVAIAVDQGIVTRGEINLLPPRPVP